jgi:hypothetical protein
MSAVRIPWRAEAPGEGGRTPNSIALRVGKSATSATLLSTNSLAKKNRQQSSNISATISNIIVNQQLGRQL